MELACFYLGTGTTYRNVTRTGWGFVVSYIIDVPVAQLAEAGQPPAADAACVEQRACVCTSWSKLGDTSSDIDVTCAGWGLVISYTIYVSITKPSARAIPPTTYLSCV